MVEQLLTLLPQDRVAEVVFALVLFGAIMGAATLFLGGLRRRATMTLIVMCLGIAIGRAIPIYFEWTTEPNATAILGAIIGAILGFLLHRLWIAIGLGLEVALLALVVLWFQVDAPQHFHAPEIHHGDTVTGYLSLVWARMPEDFRGALPMVAVPIFLVTALVGFIFARLASALCFAIAGAMLLSASLLFGEASGHVPQASMFLPRLEELRVLLFAAVVLLGTLVQWSLMKPEHKPAKAVPLPEDDS